MADVTASAAHAGKAIGHEAVDVVIEYLIPIGTGIAGLMVGPAALGGAYSLSNAINSAVNQNSTVQATRIGGLVFAGIWGAVGYALWRMGDHDGWVMKLLGKGLGGFFIGTALGLIFFSVIPNRPAPQSGLADQLMGWVGDLSTGK
jgi:hypothetical protein